MRRIDALAFFRLLAEVSSMARREALGTLSTDASGYGWGCVVHLPSGDQTISDHWDEQHRDLNISTKEMFALVMP